MGILKSSADLVYTYRFLRLLTMSWTDTDAFKLGIIDKDGKPLRKASSLEKEEERDAYTVFIRLVFNVKRLLEKVPLVGKTKLASYAAALFLIKEETNITEKEFKAVLEIFLGDTVEYDDASICEKWFVVAEDETLSPGVYQLTRPMSYILTGEVIFDIGSKVAVRECCEPVDKLFGANIYEVIHIPTKLSVYVTQEDITR